MSVQPHGQSSEPPFVSAPGKTLRAIREALLPEDKGEFDREFRAVMAEATESLDLTVVTSFIDRWWRVAWSSAEAEGHQRMLDNAARLNRGEAVATEEWSTTRARLGL